MLLLSNSTAHPSVATAHGVPEGPLGWCRETLAEVLGDAQQVLFLPYALADHAAYAMKVAPAFDAVGKMLHSAHKSREPRKLVEDADAVYVGGGNTFRLLNALWELDLVDILRERVLQGMPYTGASAGSNIATRDIRTTNDMPIVQPPTFAALGLVPIQLNPHYQETPTSTHMGETRDQRLAEFLEEDPGPILGLRELAWLRVAGNTMTLGGVTGARLIEREDPKDPCSKPTHRDLAPGADLSEMLQG